MLTIVVEGDSKTPFSITFVGEGATPLLGLLHFTLDMYLIILLSKEVSSSIF